jgi:hypothetical protein
MGGEQKRIEISKDLSSRERKAAPIGNLTRRSIAATRCSRRRKAAASRAAPLLPGAVIALPPPRDAAPALLHARMGHPVALRQGIGGVAVGARGWRGGQGDRVPGFQHVRRTDGADEEVSTTEEKSRVRRMKLVHPILI